MKILLVPNQFGQCVCHHYPMTYPQRDSRITPNRCLDELRLPINSQIARQSEQAVPVPDLLEGGQSAWDVALDEWAKKQLQGE